MDGESKYRHEATDEPSNRTPVKIGGVGEPMTKHVQSVRAGVLNPDATAFAMSLLEIAVGGLAEAYIEESGDFPQTMRCVSSPEGVRLRREGESPRYTAMAALGLNLLAPEEQALVCDGRNARDVAERAASLSKLGDEPGAIALSAWALAEVNGEFDTELFQRIESLLVQGRPLSTVATAWMVTAAVAGADIGDTKTLLHQGVERLLAHQGEQGIYPPMLPPSGAPLWRRHVGSFADQVYPLQALARAGAHESRPEWISAANRTAARICSLQGEHGQWWWHYDYRDGEVVEPYPVYSVHQHAMAPMVLLDLLESGGEDHRREIDLGLDWLRTHPEVLDELVSPRWSLIWRKVGRREPKKAARAAQASVSAVREGIRVRGLDGILPATVIDHECRPYELGWLLYAWLPRGADE